MNTLFIAGFVVGFQLGLILLLLYLIFLTEPQLHEVRKELALLKKTVEDMRLHALFANLDDTHE